MTSLAIEIERRSELEDADDYKSSVDLSWKMQMITTLVVASLLRRELR